MSGFSFQPLECEGVYLVENFFAGDGRGGFTKYFEQDIYAAGGIRFQVNETFITVSGKNVVRGLHFQQRHPQAKLVSAVQGRVWDVVVDLRPYSGTYKKWLGVELSADNRRSLFVPKGFAHGYASLEEGSMMLYMCDGAYDSKTDTGILFNDPTLGVEWPVSEEEAILSQRDLSLPGFEEYTKYHSFSNTL